MKVIAYNPYVHPYVHSADVPVVSFQELLAHADFISVHCPLTEETRNLFRLDEFAPMKPSAVLINVARGPIVDTKALEQALHAGMIAVASRKEH